VKEVKQRVDVGNVKTIIMGYVSDAQRKAVHASKADGGKGNPNKMKVKGFDVKSKKAKNKRNYSKANDYNTDKYDQSATQDKFSFTKLKMKKSPALAKLSSSCKAAARRKFDVYPSAYANMWASKQQKKGKC